MAADYDGAWKELLEQYLEPFLRLCFPVVAARVDWTQPVEFLDQELQEVVRDAEAGKLRADKLVRVRSREGREDWLLIHVEVQAQTDARLPERMYAYHHRIRDRYGRPVVSMAVLADAVEGWKPGVYEEEYWGCRLRFEYLVSKVAEVGLEQLDAAANPAAVVIAAHRRAQQTTGDMARRKHFKWQLTRGLYERGYARQDVLEIFRLIDWLMDLPERLKIEFRNELVEYEATRAMPYVTSIEMLGIEKGRQAGREEGRQEGRRAGQAQMVLRLVQRRWGAVAEATAQRIAVLSSTQLELLAEALLDFHSPADLETWLAVPPAA